MWKKFKSWIKNKWIRFKRWVIVLLGISVALAAPVGVNEIQKNNIPEHLRLKVAKEDIIQSKSINNHGDVYMAYTYEKEMVDESNEIVDKRTRSSKTFTTNNPNQFRTVISAGLPYEKRGNKWYQVETGTTTVDSFDKQTRSLFSRLIDPVFATDVNEQVGASADDAHVDGTNDDEYTHTSSSLYMGKSNGDNGSYIAGARFQTVSVPQGATIDYATTSLDGWYDPGGNPQALTVYGEDVDDAATFSSGSAPHDRTKTSASVAWTGLAGFSLSWNDSPDISSIIQEIVNRGSWASGNDMVLLYDDNGTQDWFAMEFTAYDGTASLAPKLDITYTEAATETIRQTIFWFD